MRIINKKDIDSEAMTDVVLIEESADDNTKLNLYDLTDSKGMASAIEGKKSALFCELVIQINRSKRKKVIVDGIEYKKDNKTVDSLTSALSSFAVAGRVNAKIKVIENKKQKIKLMNRQQVELIIGTISASDQDDEESILNIADAIEAATTLEELELIDISTG